VTGGRILAGVRPEKLSLTHGDAEAAVPAGRNRFTGTIVSAGFIGVSTQYVVAVPGGADLEVYVQNIERDPRLVPGAAVTVHWNPDHTFGLDAAQSVRAGTTGDAGVESAPATAPAGTGGAGETP
jgi:spermidine/putrescine transport system ATP-binding protein